MARSLDRRDVLTRIRHAHEQNRGTQLSRADVEALCALLDGGLPQPAPLVEASEPTILNYSKILDCKPAVPPQPQPQHEIEPW